jgi:hypothetical protein
MDKNRLLIIDIDGTICEKCEDRDWQDSSLMFFDKKINESLKSIEFLLETGTYSYVFLTARTEEQRKDTIKWLNANLPSSFFNEEQMPENSLIMVGDGNYLNNSQLKKEALIKYANEKSFDLERATAFEDDSEVALEYLKLGVSVIKVDRKYSYSLNVLRPKVLNND